MEAETEVSIKFRLTDGTDIGPINYKSSNTVESLKTKIIELWPKEKQNGPKSIKDVKLIGNGKILENSKTVSESTPIVPEVAAAGITMHLLVTPKADKNKDKQNEDDTPIKSGRCSCSIL
ncbi:unnamed protein product [Cuscuta epithymum]|uniref:Membrane-anchored ubiquitin-fold protein n=1 Tax=Cuscuta epithymum TaxID=186058 RepID=A0AAV0EYI4_9ASTE|nr:unnamed protein product [Cuscuta epithymum]CAH9128271.1 unnamed protein product [Cuscuta epithymum]